MKALRMREPGGPEKLVYEEAQSPFVGIGDALVRVGAASFTPTELGWPSMWMGRDGRDRRGVVPCHELSGAVAGMGYGATGFDVGDEVYGLSDWYRDGAGAEYVAVEARNLARKPASLTHVETAAVPLAGLTAWQALFDHGGLERGQLVIIHGAGGGVGTFAVQLARSAGAEIVATGHESSGALVMELGAQRFVDVDHERFEDVARGVDLVVDLVGGETQRRSWRVMRSGGVLVSVVEEPVSRPDARGVFFVVEPNRQELGELARLIDGGDVRPVIGGVFALREGREAFEAKRGAGVAGKVVLSVGGH